MKQPYMHSLVAALALTSSATLNTCSLKAQTTIYQQTFESLTTASPGGWILDNSNCSLASRNRWAIGGGSGNNVAIAGSRSLGVGPSNAGTVATALGYTAARTSDDGSNCSGSMAGAAIYAEYDFNTTGKTHITVTFKWKCTGEYTSASGGQYLDYGRFWCYDGASWWWSTDGWISYAGTYNVANKGGESNTGYFWNFGSSANNGAANTGYKWQTFYLPNTFDNNTGLAIGFEWRNDASSAGSGFIIDDITISSNGQIFLPVELVSFTAAKATEGVLLNWITASEKNNDHFTIERSSDGVTFEEIATVKGAGNSLTERNYAVTDRNPLPGISYYRLKQTDTDQSFRYFNIVSVDYSVFHKAELTGIRPNPTAADIILDLQSNKEDMLYVIITDYTGRTLREEELNVPAGRSSPELSLSALSPGVYFISVSTQQGGSLGTYKIIRN